jgi:hypothetical protein
LRGGKNAAHQAAVRAWTGERPDPEVFRSEMLPGLRYRRIGKRVAATGKKVPHPRHWDALREVARE